NPEGHTTIWSGGLIDLGSHNGTATRIPDTGSNHAACMQTPGNCPLTVSSNRLFIGPDVIDNDSSLGALSKSGFFRNLLALPPAAYRSAMVTIDAAPADIVDQVQNAVRAVIWVDGNAAIDSLS